MHTSKAIKRFDRPNWGSRYLFQPILGGSEVSKNVESMKPAIFGDVALLVNLGRLYEIVEQLTSMKEVCGLYATTGTCNLRVRLVAEDVQQFQKIVTKKIAAIKGLNVISADLITEIIKENTLPI